jgi:FKBP-type peptidyl-prolyl cis-trans isomerase SlyD
MEEIMKVVGPNTIVTIDYTLSLEEGDTDHKASMQFKYGGEELLPKLEKELFGLSIGEEKDIVLCVKDAYGEKDPALIRVVPLDGFPSDTEIKPGQVYETAYETDDPELFYVKEVEGDQVTIDYNHPLAGHTLYFHVVIKEIKSSSIAKGN